MRRSPVKRKRATPRRSARVRCPEYLAWVRRQQCIMCRGNIMRSQAHHAGERGLGQRSSDLEAVPLCPTCHRGWHDATGLFLGRTHTQRAEAAASWIAETQARARAEGVLPEVEP